jgi:hypothetical protein
MKNLQLRLSGAVDDAPSRQHAIHIADEQFDLPASVGKT